MRGGQYWVRYLGHFSELPRDSISELCAECSTRPWHRDLRASGLDYSREAPGPTRERLGRLQGEGERGGVCEAPSRVGARGRFANRPLEQERGGGRRRGSQPV